MIDTVRSEWIKLRTVRMNWVIGTIAVAFPFIVSTLTAALKSKATLRTQDVFDVVTGTSLVSALLLGVVAASGIAGEFGFGIIRPTFAATPRRLRVVAAKAVVTALFSAATAALVIVLSYSASSAIASSRDVQLSLDDIDAGTAPFIGLVILTTLLGLLGLAIGLLVRHSAAAVAILVLWPLLVENLIGGLLAVAGVEHPAKYLPYISGFQLAAAGAHENDTLGRVAGGVYFGAVVLALLALGALATSRRDA